jgi:hypothetical protein
MLITQPSLNAILKNNVCEIKFLRKRPKQGRSPFRRMICTNSNTLLLGIDGRMTLNYDPPKAGPKYNHTEKNVIVAWDLLMQSFRTINCQSCNLIRTVAANEEFWNFFRQELLPMTPGQKLMFMDS